MDRLACVDIPALPLALLASRHPDWRGHPIAVVAEDKPQAVVAYVDEAARAARILPGHRYAHALSIAPDLRAGVVPAAEIAAGVRALTAALRALSPDVEPAADRPGVFWLGGAGLRRIFGSATRWGREIERAVRERGFAPVVVVGFSRFGTYALACAHRPGVVVLRDTAAERRAANRVPLARLDLDPALRDDLARLGVESVGALAALPPGPLRERFGDTAGDLHALAGGRRWDPLLPAAEPESFTERVILDSGESDATRLVFVIKQALDAVLPRLAARKQALAELVIELVIELALDRHERCTERIRPAEPSLDARALLRLVHLRLEYQPPPAPVVEVSVRAEPTPATREQLQLLGRAPRRDLRAADRALARLRAELGDSAVVKAVLREGHLPEAQYGWEPLDRVAPPRPGRGERVLIRRVLSRPLLLPPQHRHARDDGWILSGLEHGRVVRIVGPYVISGGWWMKPLHREYHFVETARGELLWIYFDRHRRRWFLQGQVE